MFDRAIRGDERERRDRRTARALAAWSEIARKHGIAPGIHVADAAAAQRRLAEGFQFIAVASEAGMMLSKAQEVARDLGLATSKAAVAKY